MTEIRKIAAILLADVVGYSRLAGADHRRPSGAGTGTSIAQRTASTTPRNSIREPSPVRSTMRP